MTAPRPAPDDADELAERIRLDRYREEHREVVIGDGGFGTWQARIPRADGETVVTRYALGELLDELDELDGPDPPDSG